MREVLWPEELWEVDEYMIEPQLHTVVWEYTWSRLWDVLQTQINFPVVNEMATK